MQVRRLEMENARLINILGRTVSTSFLQPGIKPIILRVLAPTSSDPKPTFFVLEVFVQLLSALL